MGFDKKFNPWNKKILPEREICHAYKVMRLWASDIRPMTLTQFEEKIYGI